MPAFDRIGCELLAVKYGDFNPLTPHKIRKKYAGWDKSPEPVFWIASDTSRIGLEFGENYTEIKKHIDYSEKIYGEQGFLTAKGNTYTLFPLNLSKIFSHLDFAPLIGNMLDLEVKEELKVNLEFSKGIERFHKNEKQVMYYLTKYPTRRDNQIAKKVGLTRQSVNNIRKKFEEKRLIKTIRIPDINRLGVELMVFTHIKSKPQVTLKVRKNGVKEILTQKSQITYIASNHESIVISAFRNYTEFKRTYDQIVGYYKEKDFLLEQPEVRIFPIKDLRRFIYNRYHPIVKKIFNIR